MEKLIIKSTKPEKSKQVWKPIMVPVDIYDQIEGIADQVGQKKGYLTIELLNFAVERLEIEEN